MNIMNPRESLAKVKLFGMGASWKQKVNDLHFGKSSSSISPFGDWFPKGVISSF